MTTTIIIVLLVLLLVAYPGWPHASNWGPYPVSILGAILAIVLILMLLGRI